MEGINSLIRKKGALIGIYLGLVLFVLKLLQYYYITSLTESFFMIAIMGNIIMMLFEIAATAFFCSMLRNKIGGFWTLRQAVTGIFIMFGIAYVIQISGYDHLFIKVIDKNASTNIHTAWKNANLKTLKQGEDPKVVQQREKTIDTFTTQEKSGFISYTIFNILITIILVFVASLIFAALFKREPLVKVMS